MYRSNINKDLVFDGYCSIITGKGFSAIKKVRIGFQKGFATKMLICNDLNDGVIENNRNVGYITNELKAVQLSAIGQHEARRNNARVYV